VVNGVLKGVWSIGQGRVAGDCEARSRAAILGTGVVMSVVSADSPQEIARRDALAQRLFTGVLETMELLTVQLGVKLGLYASLHRDGPAPPES
jgi:hypothetical protein